MTPHQVAVSDETLRALEHNSLLVYSGAAHVSGSIHRDIKASYALENSPTVKAMIALREQAQAMACSLESGDLLGYASALNESCRQLYNLHESCDGADHRRYFEAVDDCILGGKTCGAGGGGFILLFCQPGRRQECIRRTEQLGGMVWPVTIDFGGVATWQENPFDTEQIERFRRFAVSAGNK
jgi:D-glycero-alpha-D-manno-heptose-7-phosphate kinase